MKYIVICETSKCENEDITINIVSEDENPIVICGPCSQPITNISVENE